MAAENGCARRDTRVRATFGSDELAVITRELRRRRAAVLTRLLRRAFAGIVPQPGVAGRLRSLARGLGGGSAQP
ncbi:MAG: hypothetical protein WCZ28_12310 [Burkholderiaceae bacterium]